MGEPIAELGGRTWEELEVQQHESGRLMFPERIRRRNAKGVVEETRVMVWIPNPSDNIRARVDARAWFAQLRHLDPDRDKAIFDELEQVCLLARAIRTEKPPHSQFCTHDELAEYDEPVLHDVLERINAYKALLDPREPVRDEESFWRLVVAVARSATILPLADTAGRDQSACIVRMALELCRSPTAQPWLRSFGISTPEPSRSVS